eukprot:TRINITY_DN12952_c0_g1_i1.p1 TRINITY_DN12952_c0_g1~~TRINITY_DN12952_c0_g1_i1.p1  ORF type:complete len:595 (+),score=214.14 TRINITY_DN12952_c0_g1_i1:60-1844(+)
MPAVGQKWLRRLGYVGAAGAGAFVVDNQLCYSSGLRSLRVVKTGLYLLYQYKVVWTPENSSEVNRNVARAITETLRANEGMYVKFGQQLSTMGHVLPQEYQEELRDLFDNASMYDSQLIKDTIVREIGVPLDQVFEWFEDEPIASASVAQVHRARLKDGGGDVAVKIQKPNVSFQITIDFAMAFLVLLVVEKAFSIPMLWSYSFTVERFKSECDFTVEAENALRAKKLLHDAYGDAIYVPEVHTDLCTKKVIVTEWIHDAVKIDDKDGLHGLRAPLDKVLHLAVGVWAHQIFSSGFVHCDPHPGNLLVRRNPKAKPLKPIPEGATMETVSVPASEPARAGAVPADTGDLGGGGCPLGFDKMFAEAKTAKPAEKDVVVRRAQPPPGKVEDIQLVLIDHGLYIDLPDVVREDYAKFWCSMILADRHELEAMTKKWGMSDADFFASMTQMKPYQAKQGISQILDTHKNLHLTKEDMAKIHMKIKEKLVTVLQDTESFPKELLFVGRALNYIRAHNWCHGSLVNRVRVLGIEASKGLRDREYYRFHFTLRVLQVLEFVKQRASPLWSLLLYVLPQTAASHLARFGMALDAAPEVMADV